MRDTIDAHSFFESGQLREVWGDDPPAHLPAAVGVHEQAVQITVDRDRPRPKGGRRGGNVFAPDGGDKP